MRKSIQQQILDLEKRVADIEDVIGKTKPSGSLEPTKPKKLAIREFLIAKKATDDVKKTLAIGYYFEKFDGFTTFNSDDLKTGYEKAKERKPININDKVNMNIKNGHMAEASAKKDNKKAWYITNSGESFVENDFKSSK